MKKFFLKLSLYITLLLGLHVVAVLCVDGNTDSFYGRLTTPKVSSMITGTSRAAQGIQPAIINDVNNEFDFYNFGFTVGHSPYGPVYRDAIKRKLKTSDETDGEERYFIVSVTPWAVSNVKNPDDDPTRYRENGWALNELTCLTCKPNLEYLVRYYSMAWGQIITQRLFKVSNVSLQDDGWLKTDLPDDAATVKRRTDLKVKAYVNNVDRYTPSVTRLKALDEIVAYMNSLGKVIIVRLPAGEAILQLERDLMPDFNEKMQDIADKNGVAYHNLVGRAFKDLAFTDGNHLTPKAGVVVSRHIAELLSKD